MFDIALHRLNKQVKIIKRREDHKRDTRRGGLPIILQDETRNNVIAGTCIQSRM